MRHRLAAVVVVLTTTAIVAASCTPPSGPAPTQWKVKPVSVEVVNQEDPDPGDEPYVIQLGFRSKVGVENSSQAFVVSQCETYSIPDTDAGKPGTTVPVPPGAADVTFPMVQNLDIGDVLLGLAPLEIFGTMSFLVERDGFFDGACAITNTLRTVLTGVLRDSLNLLIAAAPVPPTEEQLINMIVSHLGDFLAVVPGLIGAVIEGLGNPDDILGVALQIHLPTRGAFTDLMNFGLNLAGLKNGQIDIPDLPPILKFRIGHLLPSTASFRFEGMAQTAYESVLHTSVGM